MCGIAGFWGKEHAQQIVGMTNIMHYRGPDDSGFLHGDGISLGQRRLSIIDLGGGHQPIPNETGRLHLVCNGEIYNSPELREALVAKGHTFRTHTDVETILHLYEEHGDACVRHLRGMFAFAIWDSDRERLLLARDPMGQKPLFHAEKNGCFAFASEVKGVLEANLLPREIDLEALWHYMSLRYLPDESTLFRGIRKLPAAHTLVHEKGQTRIERYWSLSFQEKRRGSDAELIDALEHELLEAVKLHLLSDVPVGSFLSGGIDSGLVTAMMAKVGKTPFPTFSIGVKEQSFNELPFARMVTERYGLDGHEEVVEADIIHKLPTMIHHMDEPADPFGVGVFLVSQVAARHVKVVLSGDGGDENFAGYDRFAGQRMAELYGLLPAVLRRQVFGRLFKLVPETFEYKSLASKLRWMNEMSFYSSGERYAHSMSFLRFTDAHKQALFTPAARERIADTDSTGKILEHFNAPAASELVDRMLYTDLMTRMPDHLLAIADRMSMAHSIESRPPLIDHKITEFAASLPGHLKLRGRKLKYCLRQVAARYLPRELIERPKQGFGFPIAHWLRTDLRHFLDNLFRESRFVELGLFDGAEVRRLLDEHIGGKADHNFRIWIWLNLELWYRMYFENQSVEALGAFIEARLKKA
jgi:asparagine synthase (glutamine-hydrolysing)